MLSAAQTWSHFIIRCPHEVQNLIPIVAIRGLMLREAKSLAYGPVYGQVYHSLMTLGFVLLMFHAWPLGSDRGNWRFEGHFLCVYV